MPRQVRNVSHRALARRGSHLFRTFDDSLAADFRQLNLEWIEKYFTVEPHDLEQLGHPREHIIDPGGEILFGLIEGQVAGVCAIVKTGSAEFELAKMCIAPQFQGRGLGEAICRQAVATARGMGARRVWLASNRILKPALRVYEKLALQGIHRSRDALRPNQYLHGVAAGRVNGARCGTSDVPLMQEAVAPWAAFWRRPRAGRQ